jgi:hypothetical protein
MSLLWVSYLENQKPEDTERKMRCQIKIVLLRNAVHMPKEERLRTRYRKVTAYRS